MAMNQGALKSEILSALESCGWNVTIQYSYADCLAEAIANAVVNHIQSNATTSVEGESIL